MYRYKAEITNKSNNSKTIEESNKMNTLIKLVNQSHNIYFVISRISDNKPMMKGNK